MLSEIGHAVNSFLRLHRVWLRRLVAAEIVYLVIAVIALLLLAPEWPASLRHPNRIWFFVIPPFLFQLTLALHLGFSFSVRSPESPGARLPLSRFGVAITVIGILGLNALAFVGALVSTWVYFFALTGFPIALGLGLIPILAFTASRRFRRADTSFAAGASVAGAVLAVSAVVVYRIYHPEVMRDDFLDWRPFSVNTVAVGVALVAAFVLDPARKRLAPLTFATLAIIPLIVFAQIVVRLRETPYRARVRSWEARAHETDKACRAFAEASEKMAPKEEPAMDIETVRPFTDQGVLNRALDLMKTFPRRLDTRNERVSLWRDLGHEGGIWDLSLAVRRGPMCATFEVNQLFRKIIRSIDHTPGLEESARAKLRGDVMAQVVPRIREVTEFHAAIPQDWVVRDLGRLGWIPKNRMAEVQSLRDSFWESTRKWREEQEPYSRLSFPTDQLSREYELRFYEKNVLSTTKWADRMADLLRRNDR